ncbi:LacI family transcriptional regulator [Clostridium sp. AM29-11AC]|uniref:arabinose ABC transporter substrate-binding protein n=1 Tax=Clostridium sp. AM29-11AC TaxID=2293028 RepID=UPI000E5017C3|nr:arabinose ABC transporter substrate-binding protein [Clostridium sp. AM29-11AC]RHT56522.1 LacI family transcriptional regulator [Clostridium sp. AM29-11AC]
MKKVLAATLAVCMGLSLTACSGGETSAPAETTKAAEESGAAEAASEEGKEAAADNDFLVYGIYKAGDQSWFINEGNAAKAKVEELGGQFVYCDAQMNPETCLKYVDTAIAEGADGIVICVPDQTMSQAVVDKCSEAGIPVVAADDALEVNGEKIAPWVGIDGYNIGAANGEWMGNYAKENNLIDDEECGVMFLTMDTVSSCVPRTEGEKDKFFEVTGFDESRVFYADNDGTTDKGNQAATAVITANPQIKKWLVMSANEESAMGAVRALETAGLDKDSCVIGLGAYLAKDEWNAGKDVCMKASCYFSETAIGGTSVELLYDYVKNGTEMEMETAVPATVCTPDNYKEVMGEAAN